MPPLFCDFFSIREKENFMFGSGGKGEEDSSQWKIFLNSLELSHFFFLDSKFQFILQILFKFHPETSLYVIMSRIMLFWELANLKSNFLDINEKIMIVWTHFIHLFKLIYSHIQQIFTEFLQSAQSCAKL